MFSKTFLSFRNNYFFQDMNGIILIWIRKLHFLDKSVFFSRLCIYHLHGFFSSLHGKKIFSLFVLRDSHFLIFIIIVGNLMQKVIKEKFFIPFKCFFLMLMKVSFLLLMSSLSTEVGFPFTYSTHANRKIETNSQDIFLPFTQKVVLSTNYPFSSQVVTTCIHQREK